MIQASPEHEQVDSWIDSKCIKDLTGICPGKVFFCLQIAVADTLKIWCN
nr:MAG TPA: hypothetical protein [Caudoviricetes sp.]